MLHKLRQKLFTRVLELWVKPDVLPANPDQLIAKNVPVVYVLEVGGVADRAALDIAAKRFALKTPGAELIYGSLKQGSCVEILRPRRSMIFHRRPRVVSGGLSRIVQTSVDTDAGEVQIMPVAVYWGRAPDKELSLWKLWFSENWQFAGRIRKFFITLLHGRHTLVSFSEPLSLETLKSSGQSAPILTRKLARVLRVHFRQRRIASLGPDQSHRRMLVDHVLADPSVRTAVKLDADSGSLPKSQRKAHRYANEIAADLSYPAVRILYRLLTRLWNELYDGVELEGIHRLKRVSDGRELVYVPCHRSHVDYLLLSYILYVQGYSLPHIAAGINLNLPVVGSLLRRGGAFFLRRSFSGKPLYAAVFNAYLKELVQRGHALEYFVEGGRSRTGRLLPPKGGMLAMTVHAYLTNPQTPVVFIPVYFGYERLLEGRAFTSELAGGKKQRESIFGLLKSIKTLREDYGKVYVSIGNPIELDALLDTHHPGWRTEPVADQRPDWFKPVVDNLGNSIMCHINQAASVTPMSILATALLSTPRGCISQSELIRQLEIFQKLLAQTHAGTLVVVPHIDAEKLISHGQHLRFIEPVEDELGVIIQIRAGQTAPLTYFKNNILHLLTLPALVAASFSNQRVQHRDDIDHLLALSYPIVQSELFVPTDLDADTIDQSLQSLRNAGLLKCDGEHWIRAQAGSSEAVSLLRLAQVVSPALERDYLCACILIKLNQQSIRSDELAAQCKRCADRLARIYGRDSNELFDKHLHNSFIDSLHNNGYIECSENVITVKPALLNMESEARVLIPDSSRHAIIATTTSMASIDVNHS